MLKFLFSAGNACYRYFTNNVSARLVPVNENITREAVYVHVTLWRICVTIVAVQARHCVAELYITVKNIECCTTMVCGKYMSPETMKRTSVFV